MNIAIFNMYLSIMLSSPLFGFKYIPLLLLSISIKSSKINNRKMQKHIQLLNDMKQLDIRGIDVIFNRPDFVNNLNELNGYMYINLINDRVYEFDLTAFLSEYTEFIKIISNSERAEAISNQLRLIQYMFKKQEDEIEQKFKHAKRIDDEFNKSD